MGAEEVEIKQPATTVTTTARQEAVPPLGSVVILRATVGSTIHGTNVDAQDDRDEMAIVVEPMDYVIGLKHWETTVHRTQPDGVRSGPGDLDLVYHSLRKFCRLAALGNPTILIPLFVADRGVISITKLGFELIAKRDMFLSRHAGKSFLGYMESQRKRLAGEQGSRHGRPRQELIDKYGFDTKYAGHIIRLGLQGVELMRTARMSLPMSEEHQARIRSIRTGQVELNDVLTQGGELERELRDLLDSTPLPREPDKDAIDLFLRYAYIDTWGCMEIPRPSRTRAGLVL